MIRIYQKTLSCYLKSRCKFYPTCSEYALLSIRNTAHCEEILKPYSALRAATHSPEEIYFRRTKIICL
ncbi:MAG: membrane protein insertion efficiency factor YidD [Holosporaceae bacterium]|nr:membrane protein insertion efficiency factor YidD [Holosporaceae bacterium]